MISAEAPVLFARVRARPCRWSRGMTLARGSCMHAVYEDVSCTARACVGSMGAINHAEWRPFDDHSLVNWPVSELRSRTGVRDVYTGADAPVVGALGREQAADAAAERHRSRHHADRHFRLPGACITFGKLCEPSIAAVCPALEESECDAAEVEHIFAYPACLTQALGTLNTAHGSFRDSYPTCTPAT